MGAPLNRKARYAIAGVIEIKAFSRVIAIPLRSGQT
jgi:hypothetical protein